MAEAFRIGPHLRPRTTRFKILGNPIKASEVPNLERLHVFDAVYTSLRGRPFAAR